MPLLDQTTKKRWQEMRHVAVFHCSAPKTWKKKQSTSQVQEASDILCIFSASNHSCFTVSHLHSTLLVSRCRGSWFTGLWRFDHMEIWVCYLSCVRTRWKKKNSQLWHSSQDVPQKHAGRLLKTWLETDWYIGWQMTSTNSGLSENIVTGI